MIPAGAAVAVVPPRPFAGRDHRDRQERAERHPHAGTDQALLDRQPHQEEAAQRQRDAADPDHPLGAEAFLEALLGRRRRARRCRRASLGGLWWNRRSRLRCARLLGQAGAGLETPAAERRSAPAPPRVLALRAVPVVAWRRGPRGGQAAGRLLEQDQPPLERMQPVARPDRHHDARDGGDRNGEQETRHKRANQRVPRKAPRAPSRRAGCYVKKARPAVKACSDRVRQAQARPGAPAAPRGGSGTAPPAVRRSRSSISPVGSTSAAVSTSRRKFCLCRCRPEIASTVRCNSVSVNSCAISSNTTGRYFSLARSRAMAVARMRR